MEGCLRNIYGKPLSFLVANEKSSQNSFSSCRLTGTKDTISVWL